jgi:orotidine-5'-phosphate decarboxylase
VFGRLAYLEDEVLWRIMRRTFGPSLPDLKVAELVDISFWPRWADALEADQEVEPDVFLDFKLGDPPTSVRLIVEAKLEKHPMQEARQWAREWVAYVARPDVLGTYSDRAFLQTMSVAAFGQRSPRPAFPSLQ